MSLQVKVKQCDYGVLSCHPVNNFLKADSAMQQEMIEEKLSPYFKKKGIFLSPSGNCRNYMVMSKELALLEWKSTVASIEEFALHTFNYIRMTKGINETATITIKSGPEKEFKVSILNLESIIPELMDENYRKFAKNIRDFIFKGNFKKTGSFYDRFITEKLKQDCIKYNKGRLFFYNEQIDKSIHKLPLDWSKKVKKLDVKLVTKLYRVVQDLLDAGKISHVEEHKISPLRLIYIKPLIKGVKDEHNGALMLALFLHGFMLDFRWLVNNGSGFLPDPKIKEKTGYQNASFIGLTKDCFVAGLKLCEADRALMQELPRSDH